MIISFEFFAYHYEIFLHLVQPDQIDNILTFANFRVYSHMTLYSDYILASETLCESNYSVHELNNKIINVER